MSLRRSANTLDQGETLVETLMTVLVVGIVFVAIFAGFATSIDISVVHKYQATEQTIARDFGEYVQYNSGFAYQSCTPIAAPDYSTGLSHFESTYTLPGGSQPLVNGDYTLHIDSVSYWNGSTTATFVSTCSVDPGVQRIAFTVSTSKDSRASVSLQVVKRQ